MGEHHQDGRRAFAECLLCASSGHARCLSAAVSKVEHPGLKEQTAGRDRRQTGKDVISEGSPGRVEGDSDKPASQNRSSL